jgi:hypothetical protein
MTRAKNRKEKRARINENKPESMKTSLAALRLPTHNTLFLLSQQQFTTAVPKGEGVGCNSYLSAKVRAVLHV